MLNINQIYNEDCLSGMKKLPDGSIDFIFSDLPYGITNNSWDIPIPLDTIWKEFERIIKDNGCIALWSQSPFDKTLACSNLQLYRYEWIIEKTKATGHLNAKKMPMKAHENILIFYKKLPVYHPQMTDGHSPVHSYTKHTTAGSNYGKTKIFIRTYTNPGDIVLDPCAGSATTAVSAINTNRNFICFEKDKEIYSKAKKRILKAQNNV